MPDYKTLILALAGINVLTFFFYWHDKRCARKGHWRVPEALLLGLALAGGSPTAYIAMQLLRHKTRKSSVRIRYWLVVAVQCAALTYWLTHGRPMLSQLI